ncbi:MAG: nucleotidyltransferase protein [Candidatus Magasanikbacteria bacterium]|nr:nucleotidyltransferase protein [Candidatus Magasanikbacteria bacterium]
MAKKKLPLIVKKNINEYIAALKKDRLPIERVILFGSYAKGKQHRWSDIDLCIVSSKFKDAWRALQYLWSKRIYDSGITIEPVGFSKRDFKYPSSLIAEIKRTGIDIPV